MTKPRDWPNRARNARDRSAEELQSVVRTLKFVVEFIDSERRPRLDQTETAIVGFKCAHALARAQLALRHLESMDAPTVPD